MHDHQHQHVLLTMAVALSTGVFLTALARRLRWPAILLLLCGGMLLGPHGVGMVSPASLGGGLKVLVSLLVGVILFEGGLTLDLAGYRRGSRVILRLLSVGALVTWLGATTALWLLTGFSAAQCLIIASLVIVTGPTVIGPLLKRVRVTERLHHILHWEGVLIDPIGVFIAVLCFEALALGRGSDALLDFAVRIGSGLGIGVASGWLLAVALKRGWIAREMQGAGTLAGAVALFGLAEATAAEAGLLAVTVAGLVIGWQRPVDLSRIRHFKGEITEISIGVLFVLLSARLDPSQFSKLGVAGLGAVAAVVLLVRPLAVGLSTWGSELSSKERLFLSWVAPRGIVAASMASLFAIELEALGAPRPRFVESFTFAVIIGTILLQGSTAGWLAGRLDLLRRQPSGWLLVGAHDLNRRLARELRRAGHAVLLVDTNRRQVRRAQDEQLPTMLADVFDVEAIRAHPSMVRIGNLLAATPNDELNQQISRRWRRVLGDDHCFSGWGDKSTAAMTHELEAGMARMVLSHNPPVGGVPLVAIDAEGMCLVEAGEAPRDETPHLWLVREGSLFALALHDDLVLDLPEGSSAVDVLESLVDLAQTRLGLRRDETAGALEALMQRERAMPTLLGHGIAVPHLFLPHLEHPHCLLARLPQATRWLESEEGVDLVILLLSPADDEHAHLAMLADMARRLSDPTRSWATAGITEVVEELRRPPLVPLSQTDRPARPRPEV